ncbi:hypothetical protein [Paenibacillus eucommiae]|uniref:Uncharacterized protein n=1 Tax=Paenibacillus eucommiae TaxID=1355755 RepID=A0ABS4IMA1_9BACL|nr:hypothetical protein [Paenibacillus eucommiae]MBP1988707.1 hypothetical protein [Paenibacillus eucommiae]
MTSELLSGYQFEFYGIPGYISDIVGSDKVTEWMKQFESLENPKERSKQEVNFANVILELQVPKEAVIKANQGLVFTEEQIEAIYSGDKKRINQAFANEHALLVNGNIYTADWLAAHTATDYKAEGITEEELFLYIKKINKEELEEECSKIKKELSNAQNLHQANII